MKTLRAAMVAALLAAAGLAHAAPAAAAGTSYTWTGHNGSEWTDPGNWSPTGSPGQGDSALVEAPDDDHCATHVVGVPDGLHLAGLTVDERAYRGDADSPCLTSIDGGSITVDAQFTFHAGIIGSALTLAAGAAGMVTPGAVHDTTHFTGAVSVDGNFALVDNAHPELLSLTGSPGITVDLGGTLTTHGDNDLYANCCNSPAHVTNNGTVQLGPGTTTLDAVELDQNAQLNATGGAILLTDFAPQTAGAGARWTGNGSWRQGYSSITTVSGTQSLGPGFAWEFGGNGSTSEEYLRGTFSLAGSGRFVWGGGEIGAAMTIGPAITFTADGPDGPDPRYLDGQDVGAQHIAVTNRGSMSFTGGAGWYGVSGGQLTNASTGLLTLGAGTSVSADCCNTPATLVNSGGQVVVPAGAGTVIVDETGYRAAGGGLSVGAGSVLELSGGSTGSLSTTTINGGGTVGIAQPMTTSGAIVVGSATTVALEKYGTLTTTRATTLGGGGAFSWTAGSITGVLTVSTGAGQTLAASTDTKQISTPAGGSGTVTFTGPTTFAAGTVKAPNTVQTDPGNRLRFTGTLSMRGNTRLFGGTVSTSGATTVTAGAGVAAVTGNATLTNTGTLAVRTGTLASDEDIVQTAGSTAISAGAAVQIVGSSSALRVNGGTLAGSGQVTGTVAIAAATLAPGTGGTGTLTVTGSLTAAATATLQFELGSSSHDQVIVSGSANVHGSLQLTDLPGYQPASGDVITVLTATALTAGFSCVATAGDGGQSQHWTVKVVGAAQLQVISKPGTAARC